MEKTINNITKIVIYLIMALGLVFTVWTIMKGDDLKGNLDLQAQVLNPYFLISLITLLLAAATALLFPLIQMISNPKALVRSAISIGALALIYFISWSLASGNIDAPYYAEFNIGEGMSQFIGSLIYVVYILGSLTILTVIGSGIYGSITKR